MIYLVHREHQYTVVGYLESDVGQELETPIRLWDYRDLLGKHALPTTTYIRCWESGPRWEQTTHQASRRA